jgi:hypothetical protein
MTTTVDRKFQTVWTDYIVKDTTAYTTEIDVTKLTASDNAISLALHFFSGYSGFDQTAYGEGNFSQGLTEQQSYDRWLTAFNKQQTIVKKQITQNSIESPAVIPALPQSVYDGLVLHHWATGRVFTIEANEATYEMLSVLKAKDYDTIASMMMRSSKNRTLCVKAATVLRLADYGSFKSRTLSRTTGIHQMRSFNERDALSPEQLRRARFAYYAETGSFLPFSPESIQRDVVKEYNKTLLTKNFTYSGTSTFTLEQTVSMSPVEKLSVTINGEIQQHFYDFTIVDDQLTISKTMNTGDIIATTIKI